MNENLKEIIPKYFIETVKKYPDNPSFKYKDTSKQWKVASWKETYETIMNLACGFADLGIKPNDKIGLMADNRYEWILTDFMIQFNGAVSVPRGTDSTADEMKYILLHSDASVVIVENAKVLEKVQLHKKELKGIKHIIAYDMKGITDKHVVSFADLAEKGKKVRAKMEKEVEKRLAAIKPEDVYTIIYTSGTTGVPKGVMGMHINEVHQMKGVPDHIGLRVGQERFLSILPVWHIFERMAEYVCIAAGATTIYTNIRDLKIDIREQKPTYMASAPRLWEQIYLGIFNNVKSGSAVKRTLFKAAYALSAYFGKGKRFLQGNSLQMDKPNLILSLVSSIQYILTLPLVFPFFKLLDIIVLSKIRAATGGQLRGSISGGGALPQHVDEFFNNIGVTVLEGYGMTESAPVIAARRPSKLVIGSVGPLMPEVEVEIRDFEGNVLPTGKKGVIWTKGQHVMKGYYKMPEQTNKTIIDGWLNTGDMGFIGFNGALSIRGRAKETIVLLGGENVEPVPIENKLLQSEYISQIMVAGQDQKSLTALIYPDMEKLAKFMGTEPNTIKIESIAKDEAVLNLFKEEIKRLVAAQTGFKAFERVTDFRFITKPLEVGDEITPLGKMKRHIITEKYSKLINDMYK